MRNLFARISLVLVCMLPVYFSIAAQPPCNVTLSAVVSDETCPGYYDGQIDLTVTGSTGITAFTWSSGETTEDISSITSGTYSVSMIDANGCTASDTFTVTDAHGMTVSLGNDTTLCDITNYVLQPDAPGATFYYWFTTGDQTPTLTVSNTGIYELYVQNSYGCFALDTVVLSEYPLVELSTIATQPGCSGATTGGLDLVVTGTSGPYNYNWSNSATSQDIGNLAPDNYMVTVTDVNNCLHETNAIILASPDISNFVTDPHLICSSELQRFYPNTFGFADNGGNDYVEIPDNSNIRPNEKFTLEVWVRPLAVGGAEQVIVEKRILSGDGVSITFNPTSRQVIVKQQNSFNSVLMGSHTLLQPGLWAHIVLMSDSAHTSLWVNGVVDTTEAYTGGTNPLVGTPWTIGGGPSRLSFSGLIDEVRFWDFPMPPSLLAEFAQRPISAGVDELKYYINFDEPHGGQYVTDHSPYGSQAYFVNADTQTVWQLSNPFGLSFLWNFGDGAINNSQSPLHNYQPQTQMNAAVTLRVTSPQGCQSIDTTMLQVHTPRDPFVRQSFDPPFCIGDSVALFVPVGYASYQWSTGSTNDTLIAVGSGQYSVIADDGMGCIHQDSISLNFFPNGVPQPVITPAGTTYLCPGDSVVFDVGSGYASYFWSNGAITQTITATDSGYYFVTVANGFGCSRKSDTSTVVLLPTPAASISQNQSTLVASVGTSYQWYLNGQLIIGAIGSTYVPTVAGSYTVHVGNAGGCDAISPPYSFAVGLAEEALAGDLILFPNPTQGGTNIRFTLDRPTSLTIQLLDLQGRMLWHTDHKAQAGPTEMEIPTQGLPAGAYFLQIQGRGQQLVRMVSKI